eukprot:1645050-Pleurochrysis_carterae.AAC.1
MQRKSVRAPRVGVRQAHEWRPCGCDGSRWLSVFEREGGARAGGTCDRESVCAAAELGELEPDSLKSLAALRASVVKGNLDGEWPHSTNCNPPTETPQFVASLLRVEARWDNPGLTDGGR